MTSLTSAARHTARPRTRFASPLRMIALWHQRRQLAALDAEQLADIGISRAEADAEAARPAWDVPPYWMTRR